MSSRELEEKQQEWADKKMAKALGITYEELQELDYNTESYDTYTLVTFSDNSDGKILEKVSGLHDNAVRLDPWE